MTRTTLPAPILNAVTVDVEDWVQSVLDPDLPLTDRFYANTRRAMELFAEHRVRATFFILGLAAERCPRLVREIQSAGHEVQSHGYGHRPIHAMTPERFRQDVLRAKNLLEDLAGAAITGYRAPAFSITRRTLWALDVLVDCGITFDSSIVPARTRRYGIEHAPWHPHRLTTPSGAQLAEWPVATMRLFGRRRPIGGGGYFRLYPLPLIRRGIAGINAQGYPATIYMHPYEFNVEELGQLPHRVPPALRIHQSLGRRGFHQKIEGLLRMFRFGPIRDVAAHRAAWTGAACSACVEGSYRPTLTAPCPGT